MDIFNCIFDQSVLVAHGADKMIFCISHQLVNRFFQRKDIRRMADAVQEDSFRRRVFLFDQYAAAYVIYLGADVFGMTLGSTNEGFSLRRISIFQQRLTEM